MSSFNSMRNLVPAVIKGLSVTIGVTPPFKDDPSRVFSSIWRQLGESSNCFSTMVRCGAYEVKWVTWTRAELLCGHWGTVYTASHGEGQSGNYLHLDKGMT
jgi:hypothetical protein